ncbi:MAG: hypothetical protein HYX46_11910 [Betaproteobacteria bacterium]|nr:hypothetical protein [Betaproteobacteria bacterium]
MIQPDKSKTGSRLPEALHFVSGFLLLALVMLGIGGTIYKLLAPGGWLAQLVGGNLGHGGALVLALGGVALFAWATHDRISPTRRDRIGDWWIYLCSAVGLVYLVLMLVQGSL